MAEYDAQPGRTPPPAPELSLAQLEADELGLSTGLAGVARIVADARSVDEMLREVANLAVEAIPGADGAGVSVIRSGDPRGRIESWAVTADFVHDIDSVQYEEIHEGPCITCMQSGRAAVSGSLGSDRRWPHFGGRVARMGVHSALALPLVVGETVIGAINCYAHSRDAFPEHAVALGTTFSGPAAVAVHNAHVLAHAQLRTQQLQRALENRAVIDQAIGILRSRSGDDAETAFERLTRISQCEQIKVAIVAERLVAEAVKRARARHH